MKAIGKYIIILPEKEVIEKTAGGLLVGKKEKENIRYKKAEIISVGDLVTFVKEGEQVLYDKHAGHALDNDNPNYRLIEVGDLVVKL